MQASASRCARVQAAHDEDAPAAEEGAAPAGPPAPLTAMERTAILNSLPEDERAAAAAAVGKLSGTDVKARIPGSQWV